MKAFSLYPKLTVNGIGKNRQTYIPYIFTCSGMIMMYYIISFLSNNSMLADMPGGALMEMILQLGCVIMILFSATFLFYTNSFLIKRRKKVIEQGPVPESDTLRAMVSQNEGGNE